MSSNKSPNERHKQNSNPNPPIDLEPSLPEGRAAKPERSLPPTVPPEKTYPLGMVLSASPDIGDYAKGGIANWRDFSQRPRSCGRCWGWIPSAWEEALHGYG